MFKNARSMYFSLASLGGLILVAIGLITLLQLVISILIKTPKNNFMSTPPPEPMTYTTELKEKELTQSQKEALIQWEQDYEKWQKEQRDFNWEESNRKNQMSLSLSFLLVGLPIFLYHLQGLKKEKVD